MIYHWGGLISLTTYFSASSFDVKLTLAVQPMLGSSLISTTCKLANDDNKDSNFSRSVPLGRLVMTTRCWLLLKEEAIFNYACSFFAWIIFEPISSIYYFQLVQKWVQNSELQYLEVLQTKTLRLESRRVERGLKRQEKSFLKYFVCWQWKAFMLPFNYLNRCLWRQSSRYCVKEW